MPNAPIFVSQYNDALLVHKDLLALKGNNCSAECSKWQLRCYHTKRLMQEMMLIKCFKNGNTNLCVEGTLIIQCFLEAVCVCVTVLTPVLCPV